MNKNPFVLPGFGHSGPLGQNPILASMEMMRQAWEGLASSGGMNAASMGQVMSVEEMDKRISDLRAVENWLRMNLSMLSSTIQGLEVQRATVATLKSFMDTGMASMAPQSAWMAASPEAGAPAGAQKRPEADTDSETDSRPEAATASETDSRPPAAAESETDGSAQSGAAQPDIIGAAATAAQGWWNLVQQQFQNLAAATANSAEGTLADLAKAAMTAGGDQPPAQGAGETPVPKKAAASKTAAKKSAAGKAAAGKAAAGKSTVGKSAVNATAARKTAAKSPAARKTTR